MKRKLILPIIALVLLFTSCNKFLDRPARDTMDDESFWVSEKAAELFANGFYTNYFVAYGTADYSGAQTAGTGTYWYHLYFDDYYSDLVNMRSPYNFPNSVPTSTPAYWSGRFTLIRKANIFIDRVENKLKPIISDEAYNHWMGVARFFRALEYGHSVSMYGDMPWYDVPVSANDKDMMYKDRDDRAFVMDKVLEDFDYAYNNVRTPAAAGVGYVNKYVVATYASRHLLYEGSWQKYHKGDNAKANAYFTAAAKFAKYVMDSGLYDIDTDIRTLFGSESISSKESILTRVYSELQRHATASYNNDNFESQLTQVNHKFVQSLLASDGKPQYASGVFADADDIEEYKMPALITKVDPRFGMIINENVRNDRGPSGYFTNKFVPRVVTSVAGENSKLQWTSNLNTNDAPVIRYAEVLLNYAEAKAELGEADATVEAAINKLRNRPLDSYATSKGMTKLPPFSVAGIIPDPQKDPTVDAVVWEIRRERAAELLYEGFRMFDIKRWKKLDYMDETLYPTQRYGAWVNLGDGVATAGDALLVRNADDEIQYDDTKTSVSFFTKDGSIVQAFATSTNPDDYEGLRVINPSVKRDQFTERSYLFALPKPEIDKYKRNGYTLSQNPGW